MAVQRQGHVKGRAPSGHANRHAKPGYKEPITLILGQAPRPLYRANLDQEQEAAAWTGVINLSINSPSRH